MKEGLKKLSKKQIIIWTISIVLIVGVVGVIIYKNTPEQKAISVSNTVINSLKIHDGKDLFLTDIALKNKMDANSIFTGLSIFDYKLKSTSESEVNETHTTYKVSETGSQFASDVLTEEGIYMNNNAAGQWTEDKNVDNQVTFTSGKYKVKQYIITYDVNYSTDDGIKKESDVTFTTQEQTHGKNDYDVTDIVGIN